MRRSLVLCALLCAPVPVLAQAQVTTEMVPMRDGVRLATDVYLAADWAPGPVLLVRTTYGRDGISDLGQGLAQYGLFWVVAQDTRGRGGSEGDDTVFQDDAADGADTVAWILAQPWCNGLVGTLGGSALGITQYLLAGQGPEGLACQWMDVATPDLYAHAMFPGGVFLKALIEGWLGNQGSLDWLPQIVAHPLLDAFWDPVRLEGLYPNVNWPAMHFGGFYDIFLQGTIEAFQRFSSEGGPGATHTQKLVLGPWTHGAFFDRSQGELTYPADAAWTEGAYLAAQLDWFNWCLKGQASGVDDWPAVRYYLMGDPEAAGAPGNEWREADSWPPPEAGEQAWFLQPGGVLSPAGPPAAAGEMSFPSDPADPVPTVCGANLTLAAGPCDQAPRVESRADVAVWTSDALTEPVTLAGRVRARLYFSADVLDCDLAVRLTDVYPDGRSMLVLDGALRARHRNGFEAEQLLTPGQVEEGWVDLWSTALVFAPGHRIRVSVSGSNAPRFDPNPQTGEPFRQHTRLQPGTLTLHHGPDTPSALVLPVLGLGPELDGGTPDGDDGEDQDGDGGIDPEDDGGGTEDDGGAAEDDGGAAGDDSGAAEDDGGAAEDDGGAAGDDASTAQDDGGLDGADAGDEPAEDESGCGCGAGGPDAGGLWLGLLALAALTRRRR
ncbi:MAG TPA: CocE/NonD family hydrolase [Myxococcota bacterium]|nr:CocE/NonD family hydrolase [Myxococcota bacterium]HRY96185.1 CocE/NonD family hydrolase [Myxococcota bacterium]